MSIIQALFLGIIQGLTEFLPVSSSGHLVIFPWLLHLPFPPLYFDLTLHLGTLFAVAFYFRKDLKLLLQGFLVIFIKGREIETKNQKLVWYLILATLPAGILGFFFEGQVEGTFKSPLFVALMMFLIGILLLLVDFFVAMKSPPEELGKMKAKNSLFIGFAQALSVFPGISRSGMTISAGVFQGFTKEEAARFSFLLSIPVILGANIFKFQEILQNHINYPNLLIGFLTAFIVGFLTIKYFLIFIKDHSFKIFSFYLFALSILVFVVYFLRLPHGL